MEDNTSVPTITTTADAVGRASSDLLGYTKAGWLTKHKSIEGYWKDKSLTTNWKKRYCILKGNELHYFKEPSNKTAQGVVQLEKGSRVERAYLPARPNAFAIFSPQQNLSYVFTADSEAEAEDWQQKVQLTVESVTENPAPKSPKTHHRVSQKLGDGLKTIAHHASAKHLSQHMHMPHRSRHASNASSVSENPDAALIADGVENDDGVIVANPTDIPVDQNTNETVNTTNTTNTNNTTNNTTNTNNNNNDDNTENITLEIPVPEIQPQQQQQQQPSVVSAVTKSENIPAVKKQPSTKKALTDVSDKLTGGFSALQKKIGLKGSDAAIEFESRPLGISFLEAESSPEGTIGLPIVAVSGQAYTKGLRAGDLITAINGKSIPQNASVQDATAMFAAVPAEKRVKITVEKFAGVSAKNGGKKEILVESLPLGVGISPVEDGLRIVHVRQAGAGQKVGFCVGDVVVGVEEDDCEGWDVGMFVERLAGAQLPVRLVVEKS